MQSKIKHLACTVPNHQNSPIIGICASPTCTAGGYFCYTCYEQSHKSHQVDCINMTLVDTHLSTMQYIQTEIIELMQAIRENYKQLSSFVLVPYDSFYLLQEQSLSHGNLKTISDDLRRFNQQRGNLKSIEQISVNINDDLKSVCSLMEKQYKATSTQQLQVIKSTNGAQRKECIQSILHNEQIQGFQDKMKDISCLVHANDIQSICIHPKCAGIPFICPQCDFSPHAKHEADCKSLAQVENIVKNLDSGCQLQVAFKNFKEMIDQHIDQLTHQVGYTSQDLILKPILDYSDLLVITRDLKKFQLNKENKTLFFAITSELNQKISKAFKKIIFSLSDQYKCIKQVIQIQSLSLEPYNDASDFEYLTTRRAKSYRQGLLRIVPKLVQMSQKVIKLYVRIITCFAVTIAIFSGSEVILKFSSNGVYAVSNTEQKGFPFEANDVIETIIDKQKSLVQFSKHDHFSGQAESQSFKVGLNIDATMSLYIQLQSSEIEIMEQI